MAFAYCQYKNDPKQTEPCNEVILAPTVTDAIIGHINCGKCGAPYELDEFMRRMVLESLDKTYEDEN